MRWLSRLVDDERLKLDRAIRERHPIPDAPDLPLERRVHLLECHLGRLWDQVWWISLPWYRRLYWRSRGFRSPISHFYIPPDKETVL